MDRMVTIIAENPKLAAALILVALVWFGFNTMALMLHAHDMGKIKRILRRELPSRYWKELS